MGKLFTPVIETSSPVIFGKWLLLTESNIFSRVLGLQTISAFWLLRFRIGSTVMDTWYLVSLVTHINWTRFFENLLAPWSLQQFQIKLSVKTCELKWLRLWQATTEYLDSFLDFLWKCFHPLIKYLLPCFHAMFQ